MRCNDLSASLRERGGVIVREKRQSAETGRETGVRVGDDQVAMREYIHGNNSLRTGPFVVVRLIPRPTINEFLIGIPISIKIKEPLFHGRPEYSNIVIIFARAFKIGSVRNWQIS